MKRTTIEKLGQNLPIGFLDDKSGKLIKDFIVRPYKARVDRHLGHWREANEGKSVAYLVSKLMAMLTQKAGPHALALNKDGDSTDSGEFDVSQWYFADVMYIYVWTRIHELGEDLQLPFRCPICKHTGMGSFNLLKADVNVAETKEDLETWVDLKHGFKLRDGTLVKRVKLHPVTWGVLYNTGTGGTKVNGMDYVQIQSAISAVDGRENYTPLDSELDEVRKLDMMRLDRASNRVSAGLDLSTTVTCPGKDPDNEKEPCGYEIVQTLDWSYDSFFDGSFQSET